MADFSTIAKLLGAFVVSDDEFWSRLSSECTDESVFDQQGENHERIDLRLVDKIDAFFEPTLGEWESSTDWWHNIDCYGDGIRSVSINMEVLKADHFSALQELLVGEHEPFCILVQVHEDFHSDDDTKIGPVAIFAQKAMLSRRIAGRLATVD